MMRSPQYWSKFLAILLALAIGFYVFLPRSVDLWNFDPQALGASEARMWRHYYEENFVRLGWELYALLRQHYDVSPWDAARISYYNSQAAKVFRKSRNRAQAQAAIPYLEKSYRRLSALANHAFDARQAATLELEWWQQRREHVPSEDYAHTISNILELIYRSDDPRFLESSKLRTTTMDYRDARRNGRMTPEDWKFVSGQLQQAYALLHEAASSSARNASDNLGEP